jgi:hypothetical protein
VTERHYVRRADAVLIAAVDRLSQRIAMALDGTQASVIELRRPERKHGHATEAD